MDIIRIINFNIQIWGIVMLLTIFICLHFPKVKHRKIDRYYSQMLLMYSAVLGCEIVSLLLRGRPGLGVRVAITVSNFAFFFLSSHFVLIFFYYQNEYVMLRTHKSASPALFRAVQLMFMISVLLQIINVCCPFVYHITQDNRYERLDFYVLGHVYYYIVIVIGVVHLWRHRKELKKWEFWSFFSFYLTSLAAEIAAIFIYGIVFSEIAISSVLISIYVLLEAEYGKNAERMEQEYIDNQVEVMMSQIGPHFMFNALNTIEYLCTVESKDAPKAIEHFTDYLRMNLESISVEKSVPFSKELEHVKNYLYIEQLRFPNIEVVFDVTYQDFMIPPLTLQPIVENSVKHGLRRRKEGGVIVIHTFKKNDSCEIVIEDNGIGFDTESLNDKWEVKGRKDGSSRSHVGLQNIKHRLEIICGGVCTMKSVPGVGTAVTITIPLDCTFEMRRPLKSIWKNRKISNL